MKTLVNFSHPLTTSAKVRLAEMVGDEINEIVIPVQLDFDEPMIPQLQGLVNLAPSSFDLYIPPSLSVAAAYVTVQLSVGYGDLCAPYHPPIVVMKRSGLAGFMPAEII
jgi:hypothetical protein